MIKGMIAAGKTVLSLATMLCLISIGGAMAGAMPILVPLHWVAARSARSFEYGWWVLLATLSIWEATYIYTMLLDAPDSAVVVIVVLAAVVSILFVATTDAGRREVAQGPQPD